MFSHPVIPGNRGGRFKNCWTASRPLIYKGVLILFPTFQDSPVLPSLIIIFPKIILETASGSHSCGYQELEKTGQGLQQEYRTMSAFMWLVGQEAATLDNPENSASFLQNDCWPSTIISRVHKSVERHLKQFTLFCLLY